MRVMKKCTKVRRKGSFAHLVEIKIDHQTFTMAGYHSEDTANYYRWQLAIALTRMIENAGGKP